MATIESNPGTWARTQRRNTLRLAAWTGAWLATVALSVFGPEFAWPGNRALSIAAIVLQVAVGAGMVFANKRHLLDLDELQQRIQLNAMGITLGVTLVAGIAYSTLDIADVIGVDAEISVLVLVMGLTYITAAVFGSRRFS